jgi:hypothetical protein
LTSTEPRIRGDLALTGEEILEELGAIGGEGAFEDFEAMVEELVIGELEFAAYAAEAQVARAENESADAGMDQGAGAHDAGFERGIERGAFQTIVANLRRCLAQG